jgi:hypothetical protein
MSNLADGTVNLLPSNQGLKPPQPIIIDPKLRFPTTSRILSVWNEFQTLRPSDRGDSIVRQPYVVCGEEVPLDRIAEVEEAGARVIPVPLDPEGKLTSLTLGNRADAMSRTYSTDLDTWYIGEIGPAISHGGRGIEGAIVFLA